MVAGKDNNTMIFRQVQEIVIGSKTQTRRIAKDTELFYTDQVRGDGVFTRGSGTAVRAKWILGRRYAITPKMYQPTYILPDGRKLYVVITMLRKERLHDITEADARAEGVDSIADYRVLWGSINSQRGTRWQDNPVVWVIEFKAQI